VIEKTWPKGAAFPGIMGRTYDQWAVDGVVTWSDIEPEPLAFAELWLTQDRLTVTAMMGLATYSTDSAPRVVFHRGRYLLEDGHHRVIRAALRGATSMPMRIFRV
jgi:hypothetical protein